MNGLSLSSNIVGAWHFCCKARTCCSNSSTRRRCAVASAHWQGRTFACLVPSSSFSWVNDRPVGSCLTRRLLAKRCTYSPPSSVMHSSHHVCRSWKTPGTPSAFMVHFVTRPPAAMVAPYVFFLNLKTTLSPTLIKPDASSRGNTEDVIVGDGQ